MPRPLGSAGRLVSPGLRGRVLPRPSPAGVKQRVPWSHLSGPAPGRRKELRKTLNWLGEVRGKVGNPILRLGRFEMEENALLLQ